MRTRLKTTLLPVLFAALGASAHATELPCPDLQEAVQVAACPTDAELRYTFMGYCADNARLYGRDVLTCASFENYRAVKNTALWESADGGFNGYLSCEVPPAQIRASQALRMKVERNKSLTRLICDYDNDHRLEHRSKAVCTVQAADCSTEACRASCE
ncbi:hypothetical protein MXC99_10335 [Thauera aromatica]|uniref:hypothetical protein n=1 Tax=Thauera aromatica TaxID=59405 RepID=UPI001FFD7852|nr:hypothetical protein [Thauera aromatica]MCK2088567.1 hypothetical protein [Thauera aromatica]